MATTEQLIRRNRQAEIVFCVCAAIALGWLAALAFAFDTFDLDPPVHSNIVWATELR